MHELLQNPDPYLIETILETYQKDLLGLGYHIIKKNFSYLPLEKEDLAVLILKSIKCLHTVSEGSWAKFSFYSILKKIFVQQLIIVQRFYSTHKQNILTSCQEETDYYKELCKEEFNNQIILDQQIKMIFKLIKHQLTPEQQKVFVLYLLGYTPQKIQDQLHLPLKKIYNIIFKIKKLCANPQIQELI